MALVEQVGSVGVAEVELVIEIDAARHDVLGKRVSGLECQTVVESPLALHEECVVVVDAGADQGIELSGISGTIAPLGQKVRIQIRQHDRATGAPASRPWLPAAQRTYVVVPSAGSRFRSYALDEAKWTPCVHVVPTVMTVSRRISRSICKLPCRMYGKRKCGSTSEILEAENCEAIGDLVRENCDLLVRYLRAVGRRKHMSPRPAATAFHLRSPNCGNSAH